MGINVCKKDVFPIKYDGFGESAKPCVKNTGDTVRMSSWETVERKK